MQKTHDFTSAVRNLHIFIILSFIHHKRDGQLRRKVNEIKKDKNNENNSIDIKVV